MSKHGARRFFPVFRLVIHSNSRVLGAYEMHCTYPRTGAFFVDVDRIAHNIARQWARPRPRPNAALAA